MTSRKEELQRALQEMAHKHDKRVKGKHAAGEIAAPAPEQVKSAPVAKKPVAVKPVGRISSPRGK